MKLISLATSRWGPSLAMFLCHVLPRNLVYRLGEWLSSYLARQREHPFVKALRANMAVVHNLPEDDPEIDQVVARLLYNMLCSYIDLFRAVSAGPEEIYAACQFDQSVLKVVEECLVSGQGLLLVGAHTCSFDILLLGLKKLFPSIQVLSNANPKGNSCVMNDIRIKHGLDVTPISLQSLRQAVDVLRAGGVVVIAADIPVESGAELTFFGCESRLPVGHTRLALKTNARMVVGASHRIGQGAYQAQVSLVPRPASTGSRKQDVIRWAQDSLAVMERFIGNRPEEWLMPIPVWPCSAPEYGTAATGS